MKRTVISLLAVLLSTTAAAQVSPLPAEVDPVEGSEAPEDQNTRQVPPSDTSTQQSTGGTDEAALSDGRRARVGREQPSRRDDPASADPDR